jgi:hypothetical protein
MNILKLKEFNDDRIVYFYQPEGKGEYGEIIYAFSENEARIMKRAEENSDYYANKAMSKIEDCVKRKNLPMELTQAWY